MKKCFLIIGLFLLDIRAFSCPVCEKQQPELLRGITHGTGPQSQGDYVIVGIGIIIVLFTLFYSLKWIIRPGEKSQNHIKQHILNAD